MGFWKTSFSTVGIFAIGTMSFLAQDISLLDADSNDGMLIAQSSSSAEECNGWGGHGRAEGHPVTECND